MNSGIKRTLTKLALSIRLCGVIEMLKGSDAIQRDLDSVEGWAHVNFTMFNKVKAKVLHPVKEMPSTNTGWEMKRLAAPR